MKEFLIGLAVAIAVLIAYFQGVNAARAVAENARLSCPAHLVECN